MYGKLMSIPDHLLSIYQNQFFWETPIDYTNISGKDLMQAKKKFAFDMVCKYQNESEAKLQEAKFLSITASKSFNLQVSNYEIEKQAISSNKSSMMIAEIIYNLNIKDYSKSHVKRLINSGAVKVNDIVVNINFTVNINSTVKIKIGKQREYSVTIVGKT
jgi:hypothetical protein